MAIRATRKCKICGKEFHYCETYNNNDRFRWQEVACCPEHGAQYLEAILASRAKPKKTEETALSEEPKVEEEPNLDKSVEENVDQIDANEVSDEFVRDARYDDEEAVG